MENEIICIKCGLKHLPSANHNCRSEDTYIYCKICDIYMLSNEYKDHIYCHSLETNSNLRNLPSEDEIKEHEEEKKIEESYDVINHREADESKEERKEEIKEEAKTSCQRSEEQNPSSTNSEPSIPRRILNAISNLPYDKLRIYNRNFTLASLLENTILNSYNKIYYSNRYLFVKYF
jgi:hypothetical protein